MLRRTVSSYWHVYLCLDGITHNTLDGTYCRTVGKLRFFFYFLEHPSHSVLKVFMSGVMIILQVTSLYLADWYVRPDLPRIVCLRLISTSYNTYASSAQAGQALFRASFTLNRLQLYPHLDDGLSAGNLMALIFPLFAQKMFATLTYKWALTLFAILALVMAPTPFVRPTPLFPTSLLLSAGVN